MGHDFQALQGIMEAPFRYDYYQNDRSVVVSIYVKNVVQGSFQAEAKHDSV